MHKRDAAAIISAILALSLPASLAVASGTTQPATAAAVTRTEVEQRVAEYIADLDLRREESHIPAISIVVFDKDGIIAAEGLGLADIERNIPATADTIYCIGSTTKSMTSTLIGMLEDDGKLSVDDPISDHLPNFSIKDAARPVTIADGLSHRTGLTRMGILWAGGTATRDDLLTAVARAEPVAGVGEAFNYSNVPFSAAGWAAEEATGMTWEELITEWLAGPLGMTLSFDTPANAAKGYRWNDETEASEFLPPRDLYLIAPAGTIHTSPREMAKYGRMLLNHGELDGRRYIEAETLERNWTPIGDPSPLGGYGLGWFVSTVQDQRMVNHGGNIDGYASTFALLPEAGYGVAALMNVSASTLQQEIPSAIFNAILDIGKETTIAGDTARFEGRYKFAPLNQWWTVTADETKLFIDVPGQTNYALRPTDDSGLNFAFELAPEITLAFVVAEDDSIAQIDFTQAGRTFNLPKEGAEKETPAPYTEAQLARYTGDYRTDAAPAMPPVTVNVTEEGRLAFDVPGQTNYILKWPDDEGWWFFELTDQIQLRFVEQDGAITGIESIQAGTELTLSRISGDAEPIPSTETLRARWQATAGDNAESPVPSLRADARVYIPNQGIEGSSVMFSAGPGRFITSTDLSPFGTDASGRDGDTAWSRSAFVPQEPLTPDEIDRLTADDPALMYADWSTFFVTLKPTARRPYSAEDDTPVIDIEATTLGGNTVTLGVRESDGVLVTITQRVPHDAVGEVSVTTELSDHEPFQGWLIPRTINVISAVAGGTRMEITDITARSEFPEGFFADPGE